LILIVIIKHQGIAIMETWWSTSQAWSAFIAHYTGWV